MGNIGFNIEDEESLENSTRIRNAKVGHMKIEINNLVLTH